MPKAVLDSPILRRSTARPTLRTAHFDDYDQIAALQAANGLSTKSREEWTQLWVGNPAYERAQDWPIGWVLEDRAGQIVGVLENIPCDYRFRGQTCVAAFGRGCAVDPTYRAFSLMLFVRQRQQPQADLLMTSTANPTTASILTNTGWSRVPVGAWDQSALWIANYSKALPRYLAAKRPRLGAFARPLLSLPLALVDSASAASRRKKARFDFRWLTSFDAAFDRFWADIEQQHSTLLLSVRDRETLNWHFRSILRQDRLWLGAAFEGPRIVAYAIFERRDPASLDLNRVLLTDFQTLSPDPAVPRIFLAAALERCRREDVHLLENPGCWFEAKHPGSRLKTYRRSLGHWCYFYYPRNRDLESALDRPEAWYPTQFDTDASL